MKMKGDFTMKIKTTRKEILNGYFCYQVGYCALVNLLFFKQPAAYTSGINGWNADVYTFDNVAIVTGYRPFGQHIPYNLVEKYENYAQDVLRSGNNYDDKKAILDTAITSFIKECRNLK